MKERKYTEKEISEWMELHGGIYLEEGWFRHCSSATIKRISRSALELISQYKEKVPEEIRTALDSSSKHHVNISIFERKCEEALIPLFTVKPLINYLKTNFMKKRYSQKEIIEWMEIYGKLHQEKRDFYHFSYPVSNWVSKRVVKLIPSYKEKVPEEIRTALDSSDKIEMNVNNFEKACQNHLNYRPLELRIFNFVKTKLLRIKS